MTQLLRLAIPLVGLLILAPACDKGSGEGDKTSKTNDDESDKKGAADKKGEADKPDEKDELDPSKPSKDWATEGLSKVEDKVDDIAFSIELPADLEKEVKASDDTFPGYVTWNGPNPLMDPSFTVQVATFPPADLAAAARKVETHPNPAELARKEELEGGGFLVSFTETSKEFVNVRAWRTSPSSDKTVRVTIQTRASDPIENIDALRKWMEKVALSFALE